MVRLSLLVAALLAIYDEETTWAAATIAILSMANPKRAIPFIRLSIVTGCSVALWPNRDSVANDNRWELILSELGIITKQPHLEFGLRQLY